MSDYLSIHPENPQQRLIAKAAEIVRKGGVIVYPTDSVYAIGCHIGDKQALDRIRAIRRLDSNHNFTLMCRDLSELSSYAKVENSAFRSSSVRPALAIMPAQSGCWARANRLFCAWGAVNDAALLRLRLR